MFSMIIIGDDRGVNVRWILFSKDFSFFKLFVTWSASCISFSRFFTLVVGMIFLANINDSYFFSTNRPQIFTLMRTLSPRFTYARTFEKQKLFFVVIDCSAFDGRWRIGSHVSIRLHFHRLFKVHHSSKQWPFLIGRKNKTKKSSMTCEIRLHRFRSCNETTLDSVTILEQWNEELNDKRVRVQQVACMESTEIEFAQRANTITARRWNMREHSRLRSKRSHSPSKVQRSSVEAV